MTSAPAGDDAATEHAASVLKRTYFHAVDQQQWALFGSIFASDATLDLRGATDPPMPVILGHDAIVDAVRAAMHGLVSVHQGALRSFETPAPDHAHAIWLMEDILYRREPNGPGLRKFLHGRGYYHEDYGWSGGRWWYRHIRLERIHVETC